MCERIGLTGGWKSGESGFWHIGPPHWTQFVQGHWTPMLSMITLRRFSRLSSSTTSVLSACGQWMNQASHLVVHARPGWLGRQGSASSTLYEMVTGRLQPSCYLSLLLVPASHPVSNSRVRSWTQFGQNWRIIHFNAHMSWAYVLTTTDFQQDPDVWEGLFISGYWEAVYRDCLWLSDQVYCQWPYQASHCWWSLITFHLWTPWLCQNLWYCCHMPPSTTTHALQSTVSKKIVPQKVKFHLSGKLLLK